MISHRTRVLLAIGGGLTVMSMSSSAAAETVLSYSPWLPSGYVVNEAVMPWMERVEEVTEGRVKIVPRAAGVGAPKEQFDVIRDGLADVSLVVPGYTQGRFPLLEMGELPLLSSDAAVLSPTFYQFYAEHFEPLDPFRGAHVLSVFTVAPAQITTRDGVIKDQSDLEGVKLYISNAPVSSGMESLGAAPVVASIAETYSMASSGVIDGAIMPYEPTLTWNLYSEFDYITEVPGAMGQATMTLLVNEAKWSSISEQDRQAIMEISGEALAAEVGKAVARGESESAAKLREQGVTIEEMPADMYEQMVETFKPIDQAWADKAKEAGLENPKQVLADFRAELGTPDTAEAE
ncbi:TRAP transporter substrate-binding protein [Vreelandella titanicae]|uniref:TRAP transporter substrate-binding protein n=1 Tax=Vreelandella titanicae TaxID=664683 RepID=UPI001F1A64F6|nr:TRAP transporter substrate-binding protein [Halomonas titanicae]